MHLVNLNNWFGPYLMLTLAYAVLNEVITLSCLEGIATYLETKQKAEKENIPIAPMD
jgi:hypothetical protein